MLHDKKMEEQIKTLFHKSSNSIHIRYSFQPINPKQIICKSLHKFDHQIMITVRTIWNIKFDGKTIIMNPERYYEKVI